MEGGRREEGGSDGGRKEGGSDGGRKEGGSDGGRERRGEGGSSSPASSATGGTIGCFSSCLAPLGFTVRCEG